MGSVNIFDFIKENLKKTGIKASVGTGLKVDLKEKKLIPTTYLKLKVVDKKKFDAGLFLTAKQDFGVAAGIKIKKNLIKVDLGICTSLAQEIKLSEVKPAIFAGISFSF